MIDRKTVFKTKECLEQINWSNLGGDLYPSQDHGWWQNEDGTAEYVEWNGFSFKPVGPKQSKR